MIVLACGGRDYDDQPSVYKALDAIHKDHPITKLIHGAARGADGLAAQWAADRDVATIAVPANWERLGKSAGMVRNQQMLDLGPDLVVSFPGGRGTLNMRKLAKEAGVGVWIPMVS